MRDVLLNYLTDAGSPPIVVEDNYRQHSNRADRGAHRRRAGLRSDRLFFARGGKAGCQAAITEGWRHQLPERELRLPSR